MVPLWSGLEIGEIGVEDDGGIGDVQLVVSFLS